MGAVFPEFRSYVTATASREPNRHYSLSMKLLLIRDIQFEIVISEEPVLK